MRTSMQFEVYKQLKLEPQTSREVAETLGVDHTQVKTAIRNLKHYAYIKVAFKEGRDTFYCITNAPPPAATTCKGVPKKNRTIRPRRPRREPGNIIDGFGRGKIALEEAWPLLPATQLMRST